MKNSISRLDYQGLTLGKQLNYEKRKRKVRSLTKLLVLFVFGIFGLILLSKMPFVVKSIFNSFQNIQNDLVNNNKIDFKFRTNILLITSDSDSLVELALGSLHPTDKKVQILRLDPKDKVLFENKEIEISQIFTRKKNDPKYLEKMTAKLIEFLGVPIDGYLVVKQKSSWQSEKDLEKLADWVYSPGFFLQIFSIKNYLDKNLQTNLSLKDLNSLAVKVKSFKPDRFKIVQLQDKSGYLSVEMTKNNPLINLTDNLIFEENLTVEIINASGLEGIGTIFKNVINGLGARVIEVSSSDTTQKESEIFSNKPSALKERLTNLFGNKIKYSNSNQIDTDIKIVIGQNLAKYFGF